MLTVTQLCYVAAVVTIGILFGIVIGQPNADAGAKWINLATHSRGLVHAGLAAGVVSADATQGSRSRLLWKKPANSGLPRRAWRKHRAASASCPWSLKILPRL